MCSCCPCGNQQIVQLAASGKNQGFSLILKLRDIVVSQTVSNFRSHSAEGYTYFWLGLTLEILFANFVLIISRIYFWFGLSLVWLTHSGMNGQLISRIVVIATLGLGWAQSDKYCTGYCTFFTTTRHTEFIYCYTEFVPFWISKNKKY